MYGTNGPAITSHNGTVVEWASCSCYWLCAWFNPPLCNFCTESARTLKITWSPHGLAQTLHSPCRVCTDSMESTRSAQGHVGECKLLNEGGDDMNEAQTHCQC